jgi:FtsZ-interacting cell division protein YlmF
MTNYDQITLAELHHFNNMQSNAARRLVDFI